jgi:hypothetical protein
MIAISEIGRGLDRSVANDSETLTQLVFPPFSAVSFVICRPGIFNPFLFFETSAMW